MTLQSLTRNFLELVIVVSVLFLGIDDAAAADSRIQTPQYGVVGDQIVCVKIKQGELITAVDPSGTELSVAANEIKEIADYVALIKRNVADLEDGIGSISRDIGMLRGRLGEQYDNAFLEMIAACSMAAEHASQSKPSTGYLTETREAELRKIVKDYRDFDVNRFVHMLDYCDFYAGLVDYASDSLATAKRRAELETEWLKTEHTMQTDGKRPSTDEEIATSEERILRHARGLDSMTEFKTKVTEARDRVDSIQQDYFRLYEKAGQVFNRYGALRERTTTGESIAGEKDSVLGLAADWSSDLLTSATLACVRDADSALAELDRRRGSVDRNEGVSYSKGTDHRATTREDARRGGASTNRKVGGDTQAAPIIGCVIVVAIILLGVMLAKNG